jgi:oligopeptide transport system permease protein
MAEITLPPQRGLVEEVHGRSLWADARRRLLHNKAAVAGMIVLAIVALLSILAPYLSPFEYDEVDFELLSGAGTPPDFATGHYFGTDENGRDLFVRVLYGGRVSLMVGIVATIVSLFIGVAWGATAGFLGGRIDAAMMRIVDILYALPFVFFVIMLMVIFGRDILLIFVAIGAISWLDMARIVRGQTLSLKRKEFIGSAPST